MNKVDELSQIQRIATLMPANEVISVKIPKIQRKAQFLSLDSLKVYSTYLYFY